MKRIRFEERVKAVPDDMNGLSEVAEDGIGELIRSISGGLSDILFENKPLVITHHPAADITIDVLAQAFGAGGVPGYVAAATIVKPDVRDYHKVWLIVGRTDVLAFRDRLIIAGPVLSVASQNLTVEDDPVSRIETTSSGDPAVAPLPPVLVPSDIGYVELGGVYSTIAPAPIAWTATHNTAALYTFPGLALPLGHWPSHVPGGTDIIQMADPTKTGLMPPDAFIASMGALQDVFGSPASPHLTSVTSGDNSPGNPKQAEVRLRSTGSFVDVLESGDHYLGLNFPPAGSAYGGASVRPARSDHRHSPEDSPVAIMSHNVHFDGTFPVLGKLLPEIEFTGVSRILQAQVFWSRPGHTAPEWPSILCEWMKIAEGQFIGVNAVITDSRKVRLQVGNVALLYMNDETLAYIKTIPPLGVTWPFFGTPNYPTEGEIFVRILGIR
jgi:hypothetical protein